MYKQVIKPFFDKLIAGVLILLTSPVLLVVILILYWQNRGKVWFIQERPGYQERPFFIIKFKTMTDARDAYGNLLPDMDRTTRAGHYIRKFSLDELPQLFNVVLGQMSMVGPRPLLMEYLALYNQDQRRRHEVKPGITGWAQVNGRNTIDWSERLKLDVWYVDHQNFTLDFKILLLTAFKVIRAADVNKDKAITMEKFKGNAS